MNNTSGNATVALCDDAKFISHRSELKVIYILQCIFGLMALFPNVMTLNLLWRVKIFHANLRLILANLTCNLLIYSLTITLKAFNRLTIDVCDLPMLLRPCMAQEFFVVIPLHNALISVFVLSLERLYATIRFRSYDYSGSIPFLGLFLLLGAWTTTLTMNVPNYFKVPQNQWMPVCEISFAAKPGSAATIVLTMFVFEASAAVVTIFVYIYNRYILGRMTINRALYNLSSRFQVGQNVQLNTALMPGMILHMMCHLPSYILLSSMFTRADLQSDTLMWLLHLTYLWRMVYAVLDPIFLMVLNTNLRQALKKSMCGNLLSTISCCSERKTQDVNLRSVVATDAHFDYLQQAWAVKKAQGQF